MAQIGYWIVKGNPRYPIEGVDERSGDIIGFLRNGEETTWVTYKYIQDDCHVNDRVFFWQSSPFLRIVGLGKIVSIESRKEEENFFTIYHKKGQSLLNNPVGIQDIRDAFDKKLDNEDKDKAGYLKRSVVATIYKVSSKQATILKELVHKLNPKNETIRLWLKEDSRSNSGRIKLSSNSSDFISPEEIHSDEIERYHEGALKKTIVNAYERQRPLRDACIAHYAQKAGGRICCYVCGFDFELRYGRIGKNYIHVHHELQLSLVKKKHSPDPIKEMKPLCPNCHAMIHVDPRNPLTVQELKHRLK